MLRPQTADLTLRVLDIKLAFKIFLTNHFLRSSPNGWVEI